MLTIKNIETTKSKEFKWEGKKWILHEVDVNNIEYRFMFIPKTKILDVYVIQNAQLVILDRKKKRIGREVLGYRLWTTDGRHTYIDTKDIPKWTELVHMVIKNKMIE
jgi:hypothetical protein